MCDKNRKRPASDTCLELTLKRFKQSEDPAPPYIYAPWTVPIKNHGQDSSTSQLESIRFKYLRLK